MFLCVCVCGEGGGGEEIISIVGGTCLSTNTMCIDHLTPHISMANLTCSHSEHSQCHGMPWNAMIPK